MIKFETHVIALFIPKEGDGRISIHVCEREGLKEMVKGEKGTETGKGERKGTKSNGKRKRGMMVKGRYFLPVTSSGSVEESHADGMYDYECVT